MKPRNGFSKEIYSIVKAHGPLAYNGIHSRLRERSVRMSKDQVKKTLSNMVQRDQLVRSEHNPKKFVVVGFDEDVIISDPVSTPPVDLVSVCALAALAPASMCAFWLAASKLLKAASASIASRLALSH